MAPSMRMAATECGAASTSLEARYQKIHIRGRIYVFMLS